MGTLQHDLEIVVGQNVKAACEALRWKQIDLAERVGVTGSTIAKLEVGRPITAAMLSSTTNILGTPPYMLMLRNIDLRTIVNISTWHGEIGKYKKSRKSEINSEAANI